MRAGLVSFVLPLLFLANNAQAASFDCAEATTKVEKMICGDAELSKLDEEMASAYAGASEQKTQFKGLKEQQREWLRERNRCLDAGCMQEKYRQRLDAISKSVFLYNTIYPVDISEFNVDCNKAKSDVEKVICRQAGSSSEKRRFAEFERNMRPILQWALMRTSEKKQLLDSQRKWVKEIRDTCMDTGSCIKVYEDRIEELRVMWERPGNCYTLKPLSDGNGHVQLDELGNIPLIESVCQAMEENLNQFCDQPPMACDLKVAPRFQGQITFPEWVPLEPKANLALIERFIRAPWEDSVVVKDAPQRRWEEERPKVEVALAANRLTFSKAQLDLYNLGRPQLAYRLNYGTCNKFYIPGPTPSWKEPISSEGINIQQAPEVIRSLFQKYNSLDDGTARETFLYGGQTFTYAMTGSEKRRQMLFINRHEKFIIAGASKVSLHQKDICVFDYQPTEENEK